MEDRSTTHQDLAELISMLQTALINLQDPTHTPHASREERTAARRLYEDIVAYKANLRKRPLTRPIEFITRAAGPGFSTAGTGWYYQPIGPKGPINWIGPFSSHHEAEKARLATTPRSRAAFLLADLLTE